MANFYIVAWLRNLYSCHKYCWVYTTNIVFVLSPIYSAVECLLLMYCPAKYIWFNSFLVSEIVVILLLSSCFCLYFGVPPFMPLSCLSLPFLSLLFVWPPPPPLCLWYCPPTINVPCLFFYTVHCPMVWYGGTPFSPDSDINPPPPHCPSGSIRCPLSTLV